jgi:hypothetical protein
LTGVVTFAMASIGIGIATHLANSKNAAPTTPVPITEPVTAVATPSPVVNQNGEPVSTGTLSKRLVELTGFRVRPDRSGKTIVQYVVINHSNTDMRGLTAHVVLRSASAKPSQAPIANFSVRLPGIAAQESKDLTTLVETPVMEKGVPDWTDLRAEVRIEQ